MYETVTIKPDIPVQVLDAEALDKNKGLANEYTGLCEYSEAFWLGYLAYNYLNYDATAETHEIQPALVESWSEDGKFLGIAVRKLSSDHPHPKGSFGEETELLLWSPYPELIGNVVSNEDGETVCRELGLYPIDRAMLVIDPWKDLDDAVGYYDEVNKQLKGYVEGQDDLERQKEVLSRLIKHIIDNYDIKSFIEVYSEQHQNGELIPPSLRER